MGQRAKREVNEIQDCKVNMSTPCAMPYAVEPGTLLFDRSNEKT